jgi:hypothetical protein
MYTMCTRNEFCLIFNKEAVQGVANNITKTVHPEKLRVALPLILKFTYV